MADPVVMDEMREQRRLDRGHRAEGMYERVRDERLVEHMSGDSETSHVLEAAVNHLPLWHRLMNALVQSLTDEAEAGRQLHLIYIEAAGIDAERAGQAAAERTR